MDWAIKIMRSKSKTKETLKQKELVIEKILPTCVPRLIKVTREDGQLITLEFDEAFNENDFTPETKRCN